MEEGRWSMVKEHFADVIKAIDDWVDISGCEVREDSLLLEDLEVTPGLFLAVLGTLRTNLGIPMPKMKYLQRLHEKVRSVSDLCDYVANATMALADQVASSQQKVPVC